MKVKQTEDTPTAPVNEPSKLVKSLTVKTGPGKSLGGASPDAKTPYRQGPTMIELVNNPKPIDSKSALPKDSPPPGIAAPTKTVSSLAQDEHESTGSTYYNQMMRGKKLVHSFSQYLNLQGKKVPKGKGGPKPKKGQKRKATQKALARTGKGNPLLVGGTVKAKHAVIARDGGNQKTEVGVIVKKAKANR